MKEKAQVVVIGGGVVGCSILYHLTKLGCKDALLIEREELTVGSTWHAAGGMHTLNSDPNVAKLQKYTIELYKEIEEISGQACGLHLTGGVMLAGTQDRLDWLKAARARGRYLGLDSEVITPSEAKKLLPLIDEKYFVGALYDDNEGHVDPYGVTHAYAKAARIQGAEIALHTHVKDLQHRPDGTWDVITDKGNVHAEHVVNAGGLWAREVGRMVGLELPILAMEHMYLLTEEMPEVKEINESTGKEVLHAIDFEGELYLRQERGGMLMGTYEKAGKPWSERETPWNFVSQLLEPDIDRIAPSLEVGFSHFPAIERAGIRRIINGPFVFAGDGNPLIGPVRGLKNYWCACAIMAGFSQGGGVGLALSNWIINGDPGFDIWAMDIARYGDWATMAYTNAKVRENYSRRFQISFPNEELTAARPLRTTPLHERLTKHNAVWGSAFGLETALWFQRPGQEPKEDVTFKRSNAFDVVAEECQAVRERVGLMEIAGFAKYEVTGPGAEVWLSYLLANRMPVEGKMVLAPMLNPNGMVIGDFTVAKAAQDRFFIFGSGVAEEYHMRWFEDHLPESGVTIRSLRTEMLGLSVAGPKSRELLQGLTHTDLSTEAMPFMSFKRVDLGMISAWLGRITFTGDLGYELWVSVDQEAQLFDMLMEAGKPHDMRLFGGRALDSLRLEKNFGTWAREYRPIYNPYEAAMGRFVSLKKNDFIGADASRQNKENGPSKKFSAFAVDAIDGDVMGDEPVWYNDEVVGWITSGGYAHYSKTSVAIGYVDSKALPPHSQTDGYEVEILGVRRPARLLTEPLFDPAGERMRM